MKRLKYVASVIAGQSPASEAVTAATGERLPFLQGNAEFGAKTPSPRWECEQSPKRAQAGDLLVSVRAPVGAVNIADRAYGIGRGLCAVRPQEVDARFLYWFLRNCSTLLNSLATGSTFTAVSADLVGDLRLSSARQAEQRHIADYLDRETAQIDALIGKQERLIETLRERRASVVAAVFADEATGQRARLGHLLSARPRYGVLVPQYTDETEGVPLVRVGDLPRLTSEVSLPRIQAGQSGDFPKTVLRGGEVLLGVVGRMGQAAVVPDSLAGANVARAVAVLRPSPGVDAGLLAAWIGTAHFKDQAFVATSADTVQPTLGMGDLGRFDIMWPNDSVEASSQLRLRLSATDALIAKAEKFIALARERRAALITAAVTGQIDVRTAA